MRGLVGARRILAPRTHRFWIGGIVARTRLSVEGSSRSMDGAAFAVAKDGYYCSMPLTAMEGSHLITTLRLMLCRGECSIKWQQAEQGHRDR
jgi:hypothetical protein